ncbi:MAG: hypothetical protein II937_09540 [Bacteroidales bacterium]|nr:hypothetical protein [Bacteroidales bacterium]
MEALAFLTDTTFTVSQLKNSSVDYYRVIRHEGIANGVAIVFGEDTINVYDLPEHLTVNEATENEPLLTVKYDNFFGKATRAEEIIKRIKNFVF